MTDKDAEPWNATFVGAVTGWVPFRYPAGRLYERDGEFFYADPNTGKTLTGQEALRAAGYKTVEQEPFAKPGTE